MRASAVFRRRSDEKSPSPDAEKGFAGLFYYEKFDKGSNESFKKAKVRLTKTVSNTKVLIEKAILCKGNLVLLL